MGIGVDPGAAQYTLTGLEQQVLQILAAFLVAGIGVVLKKALDYLGVKNSDAIVAKLDDAATKSVQAGVMKSLDVIKAKGWDHIEVHGAIASAATSYIIEKFPEALSKSGIDPSTPEGLKKIGDIVNRVLPSVASDLVKSPVTPDEDAGTPAPASAVPKATP